MSGDECESPAARPFDFAEFDAVYGGPASSTGVTGSRGGHVLDRVATVIRRHCVLPGESALVAVVLWVAASHAQPAWQHATRLVVRSPEKRCGKSRLLDLVAALSWSPLVTVNATPAAVFRSLEADDPPTLVIDEADAIFGKKSSDGTEELRGLLNAGFGRGRPALRCVGPRQEPTAFETFAMAALAAIGDVIPDTITDRAVVVTMRRRAPDEAVAPFRHRRDGVPLETLRAELHGWVRDQLDELGDAEPALPVEDRAADRWEPLVAIADAAGGAWPARARAAAMAMTAEAEQASLDDALATRLLADVRDAFLTAGRSSLTSAEVVKHLLAVEEAPWAAFGLNVSRLAYRLRPYDIRPRQIRTSSGGPQARGYTLDDLRDAFDRYLPAAASQGVTPSQPQVSPVTPRDAVTGPAVTDAEGVTALTRACDGVTARDAPEALADLPACAGCAAIGVRLIPHHATGAPYCPACCRELYPEEVGP